MLLKVNLRLGAYRLAALITRQRLFPCSYLLKIRTQESSQCATYNSPVRLAEMKSCLLMYFLTKQHSTQAFQFHYQNRSYIKPHLGLLRLFGQCQSNGQIVKRSYDFSATSCSYRQNLPNREFPNQHRDNPRFQQFIKKISIKDFSISLLKETNSSIFIN